MKLRLDPWATEYNTALFAKMDNDDALELPNENAANVDTGVECPSDAWHAITPDPTTLADQNTAYDHLYFLDGSRRIEARVLLEDNKAQVAFGALGTYGVGAVQCPASLQSNLPARYVDEDHATPPQTHPQTHPWIKRLCILSSGYDHVEGQMATPDATWLRMHAKTPIQLGDLLYHLVPTTETDADAVIRQLQREMRQAEAHLAARLARNTRALIIMDGPRPLYSQESHVLGYIKTIHNLKLNQAQLSTVQRLTQGQRSPLYLVTPQGNADAQYFEWFMRLRSPHPWVYSLAGTVRLQAYGGAQALHPTTVQTTRTLADWLTITLLAYASRQHQDPRAPQQLLPVRALEAEIRRRMGHPAIIRRRITEFLSTN